MHRKTESKFIDKLCRQNNMHQMIKDSTRITETSSTLIDIVLTNFPSNVRQSSVVPLGLSDHNLVYVVRKLYRPRVPPRIITYRSMKRFNANSFVNELNEIDWDDCIVIKDITQAWTNWKLHFLEICNKHAPLVTHRVKGAKTKWVTDEYVSLTHLRDRLKKKAEKQNTALAWGHYRAVRNHANN